MGIRFAVLVVSSLTLASSAWTESAPSQKPNTEGQTLYDGVDVRDLAIRVANLEAALRSISPTALPIQHGATR